MYLCVSSVIVDLSFISSTLIMLMKSTKFICHDQRSGQINYNSRSVFGIEILTTIESIVGTSIKRNKRCFKFVVQQYVSSNIILMATQGKINRAGKPKILGKGVAFSLLNKN